MHRRVESRLAKWPFIAGDVLLLGVAMLAVFQSRVPLELGPAILCASAVSLGALLCVAPFVLEYRAAVKLDESDALLSSANQLKNLDLVADRISAATGQWQTVQEYSTTAVNAAKQIAESMAAEVAAFTEFLQKANDSERATLRLEVEKLRRAENDWLQVVLRILDHVFALNRAAARSGQPALVEQLANFQNACRDIARRIGLVPFEAASGQPFETGRHKLMDSEAAPPAGSLVGETIAVGYTYQGQPLRPALVSLQPDKPSRTEAARKDVGVSNDPTAEPTLL